MDKENEKAFDLASESTKQLITLATAIIALTVTFSKDIIGSVDGSVKILIASTWAVLIISVIFGILTMMAMAGTLSPLKKPLPTDKADETPLPVDVPQVPPITNRSINSGSIRTYSKWQILFFLIGIILTVIFGYRSLGKNSKPIEGGYKIMRQTRFGSDTTVYRDTVLIPVK